jgi:hypothetical protein
MATNYEGDTLPILAHIDRSSQSLGDTILIVSGHKSKRHHIETRIIQELR